MGHECDSEGQMRELLALTLDESDFLVPAFQCCVLCDNAYVYTTRAKVLRLGEGIIDQRLPKAMCPVTRKNGKAFEITYFRIRTLERNTPYDTVFSIDDEIDDTPAHVPFYPIRSAIRRMARRILFVETKAFCHCEERLPNSVRQNLHVLFRAPANGCIHCTLLLIIANMAFKRAIKRRLQ